MFVILSIAVEGVQEYFATVDRSCDEIFLTTVAAYPLSGKYKASMYINGQINS